LTRRTLIAVIGDTHVDPESPKWQIAEELGKKLVDSGYCIVNGGIGDMPCAVSRGARQSSKYTGSSIIAILPGFDPKIAEQNADIIIPTGIDYARNLIIANSDAVIALGGGAGTLNEIAYAWELKRLILAFDLPGWSRQLAGKRIDERQRYADIVDDKIFKVTNCNEAVALLKEKLHLYNARHRGVAMKTERCSSQKPKTALLPRR